MRAPVCAELVRACLEGDQDAWRDLVDMHANRVWAIAVSRGLTHDDRQEVLHTSFIIAWQNLSALREPEKFGAWVARIADRRSLAVLRARRARPVSLPTNAAVAHREECPDRILERLEEARLLRWAIDELDELGQTLVRAMFLEDEPRGYDEIAQDLGHPVGSLGPYRQRCLERLRTLLAPHLIWGGFPRTGGDTIHAT